MAKGIVKVSEFKNIGFLFVSFTKDIYIFMSLLAAAELGLVILGNAI